MFGNVYCFPHSHGVLHDIILHIHKVFHQYLLVITHYNWLQLVKTGPSKDQSWSWSMPKKAKRLDWTGPSNTIIIGWHNGQESWLLVLDDVHMTLISWTLDSWLYRRVDWWWQSTWWEAPQTDPDPMVPMYKNSVMQGHGWCRVLTDHCLLLLFCEHIPDIFWLCLKTTNKLSTSFSSEGSLARCYVNLFLYYVTLRMLTMLIHLHSH